ncbi:BtrH N-terminal domain-containing protein [Specibacter sp. RAF43]|uniref:BtrH N-terminal domain-containing protein n=1 Tax=Specibacter sp. RAF43 TaxID=3233057 RepID=UPI003F9A46C2
MPVAYDPRVDFSHWDSGLWRRVLAASTILDPFTGRPFTEPMLFGLGGGAGFMIFTFEYKDITTASIVTRFHPGPFVDNMIRRSGAAVAVQQTGSAQLAQARLDAALETGASVVVRLVRGRLPWVAADPLADMGSVDVAVAGRDGAAYLVDDGAGRLERVDAPTLAAARAGRKADKHWQAQVESTDGSALTGDVVRDAVLQGADALLAQTAPPGIPAGYAKNFGIAGMTSWAHRLADTSTKRGWARLFADPARAEAGLGMLHGLLAGRRYSGPGALRPLQAGFLREAAQAAGAGDAAERARWMDAAAQYGRLGAHWDDLAGLIGAAGAAVAPDFAAMANAVEVIAELESEAARTVRGR